MHADKNLQLSIQNMIGGGRPTGGRHGSTKDTPSWTTIGLIFSFDHKGDPEEAKHTSVDKESHNKTWNMGVTRGDEARWVGWWLAE